MGYVDIQSIQNPTVNIPVQEAWFDGVRTALEYLARNKPHGRVYNSANISISNATFTAITFDSERVDVGGVHSTVTNTGRLTVPSDAAGWWDSKSWNSFVANATANRGAMIRLNGSTYIGRELRATSTISATSDLSVALDYQLVGGDYLESIVYQDSGGALNLLASPNYSPEFSFAWRAA